MFIWEVKDFAELILTSSFLGLISIICLAFTLGTTKRVIPIFLVLLGVIGVAYGWIFVNYIILLGSAILMVSISSASLMANPDDFMKMFSNIFKKKAKKSQYFYDNTFYENISNIVLSLSKVHRGALITIERNDDLAPYYEENGILINAPISVELLDTIFYPGTRLHDGAVIIQQDKISAASVFYNLSTKRYQGKIGSRHRAALGISEATDSISIVVSEETGEISIATNGCLETIAKENFKKMLKIFMENENLGGENE